MPNDHLSTYLSDHLAGASAALELIAHFQKAHGDHPAAGVVAAVAVDIEEDRRELEALAERVAGGKQPARRAAGWLAERLAWLKLRLDDPSDGAFRVYESLEMLSLGVEGKRALWLSLQSAAADNVLLQHIDFDRLRSRAEQQRAALEAVRLPAAREAFTERRSPADRGRA